jgi:hypothetical protein
LAPSRALRYYPRVKVCVSCGKALPDAAIVCVFCRARQHEERLDPTPVRGIRHDARPADAIAEAERSDVASSRESRPVAEPRRVEPLQAQAQARAQHERRPTPTAQVAPRADASEGAGPAATREERSVLIQLGQWNRNERPVLAVAGLALLVAVLAYQRSPLPIVIALAIVAAGLAPLPRLARGAIAFGGGLALLWRLFGPAAAGGLVLLPGALLSRAKSPSSRLAQLWGLVGAGAIVAAYLVPRGGQSLARMLLDGFRADQFILVATAIWLALAVPLAVVGLLALTPRKTIGGCVLWASVMLLWAPVGLLLMGFWSMAPGAAVGGAALVFGSSVAAAVGLADLSA